jgi:hypothetical protein
MNKGLQEVDEWAGDYSLEYLSARIPNRKVTVNNGEELYRESRKGLMSRDVGLEWDDENNKGVITAGMRTVGHAIPIQPAPDPEAEGGKE